MVRRQHHAPEEVRRQQARGCHHQRQKPVERHDADDPVGHEPERRRLPFMRRHPHDEAADHEEDIDAALTELPDAAVKKDFEIGDLVAGVMEDYEDGRESP